MQNVKATDKRLSKFIEKNQYWCLQDNKLHREFVFSDFVAAFGFMAQVALIAERSNHHPEWLNVYKKVVVNLTTHEVNGISKKDFKLALEMDKVAEHFM
ncbi:MAG: 4a-hydroxytetrahydrobiopterin dehydratase [gamma proteobacterium symbiont of Taylorina sp.]|nr:4a-hydroxytetrahydrobiopterin dehydratase [gamma proteobacterium symbiont of Taylorina sp.]